MLFLEWGSKCPCFGTWVTVTEQPWNQFSSSAIWVMGIEFRSLGLETNAFTQRAIYWPNQQSPYVYTSKTDHLELGNLCRSSFLDTAGLPLSALIDQALLACRVPPIYTVTSAGIAFYQSCSGIHIVEYL